GSRQRRLRVRAPLQWRRPDPLETGPRTQGALGPEGAGTQLRRQERRKGQGPVVGEGIRRLCPRLRLALPGEAEEDTATRYSPQWGLRHGLGRQAKDGRGR